MDVQAINNGEAQRRVNERVHLFLAATLRWNEHDHAVRIRNLSVGGALIEGAVLPVTGTPVVLSRGSLRASGRVAWNRSARCGLRLDQRLDPAAWSPAAANRAHQARIDGVVAALRSQSDLSPAWHRDAAIVPASDDLRLAQRLLTGLADRLADDEEVIARCGHELQRLDLVVQLLGALGDEEAGARLVDLRFAARASLDSRAA